MSELQHPESRSFELVAELYERTRPAYPDEAVAWLAERLGIDSAATVLDLGAGTGKLSRALVGLGAKVIAVEPGPEMLAQLVAAVPEAEPILGAAEAIPLDDATVDAVTCGQSFHWFRAEEAIPEIHRVLRRNGGLGLIWNMRHPDDALQHEITTLLQPFVPASRSPVGSATDAIEADERFGSIESRTFSFEHLLDADELVDRIGSISFVAAADPTARAELERDLRALADRHGGAIPFRYLTDAYVTFAA